MSKRQRQSDQDLLRARVERVVGPLDSWESSDDAIKFLPHTGCPLAVIIALAEELGTEAINFNFGSAGERGYSDLTPSVPGAPGYVEVIRPIKGTF
jgi:hypothetical protein